MPSGDEAMETLRFLLERAHTQWNERRKYEWFAFGQFLTVLVVVAGATIQVSTPLSEDGKCLLFIFAVLILLSAATACWFLCALQGRNVSEDPRIRALNNKLVDKAVPESEDKQTHDLLRRNEGYPRWSLAPQVTFISLMTIALIILLLMKVYG